MLSRRQRRCCRAQASPSYEQASLSHEQALHSHVQALHSHEKALHSHGQACPAVYVAAAVAHIVYLVADASCVCAAADAPLRSDAQWGRAMQLGCSGASGVSYWCMQLRIKYWGRDSWDGKGVKLGFLTWGF
jgi:hypothetical protein